MSLSSHDDMVVDSYTEKPSGLCDALRDLDIRATGLGISARMVMDENESGCPDIERLPDYLSRVDCCLVDRTVTYVVIEDQSVLRVEI